MNRALSRSKKVEDTSIKSANREIEYIGETDKISKQYNQRRKMK